MTHFAFVFLLSCIVLSSASIEENNQELRGPLEGFTPEEQLYWKNNCDFKGRDIKGITNPILGVEREQCQQRCYEYGPCSHFTWYNGRGTKECYLKEGYLTSSELENIPNLSPARCGVMRGRG